VEVAVRIRNGRIVARGNGRFELHFGFAKLVEVISRSTFRRAPDEHRLKCRADVEQILDKVAMNGEHAGAAIRLDDDQSLAVQNAQGLANRHVTDAVAAGEVIDPQARPERQFSRHDVVSQKLFDVEHG
jgi:hypothetical protein